MSEPRAPFIRLTQDGPSVRVEGVAEWASVAQPEGPKIGLMRGAWTWDGTRLRAEVDRYGFYNLFVYAKDGVVAVSPSLLELVAQGCDATPDARALAVFHRLGIFINDDTPLRHVRTLPPAGRLEWHDGKFGITGHTEIPRAQKITRDQAVEGMRAHFSEAMARIMTHVDGRVILPLSGGRDSRHILLEMMAQGHRPQACVTFHHNGAQMNREAQAARAVCARVGVRHDVLGHARPRLADMLRVLALTGLCADEHAQMMPLHDYFAHRDAIGFDGIAGDILTNPDDWADDFFRMAGRGDYRGIALGMMEGHGGVISQALWAQGAGPIHSPGWDGEVLDYVGRAVAYYADAPDPYQLFWMYHRTRREINFVPQAILSPAKIVFTPYLDPAFADFCMSLPYSVTVDQQLHNDVLRIAYPQVADIPFQEGFAEPPRRRGSPGHKLRSLADAWAIAGVLAPDARLDAVRRWVRPRARLKRQPGDVYDLHGLCVDGLDADRARAILALAARLEARAPTDLLTDRLEARA